MNTTNPSKPIANKLPIIKIIIAIGLIRTPIVLVEGATK